MTSLFTRLMSSLMSPPFFSPSRGSSVIMRGPNSQRCLGPNVYPEVPDGGWGWAVAAAFFLVEVCTYGTLKSLGVFLQDLMEEFGESNSRVSWAISICVFIFTFTGQWRVRRALRLMITQQSYLIVWPCPTHAHGQLNGQTTDHFSRRAKLLI